MKFGSAIHLTLRGRLQSGEIASLIPTTYVLRAQNYGPNWQFLVLHDESGHLCFGASVLLVLPPSSPGGWRPLGEHDEDHTAGFGAVKRALELGRKEQFKSRYGFCWLAHGPAASSIASRHNRLTKTLLNDL